MSLLTLRVSLVIELSVKKYRGECENSRLFCELMKTKYLNDRDIRLIKKLGYRIELIKTQPDEL